MNQIEFNDGEWVIEDRSRLNEADLVLAQISGSFSIIPLKSFRFQLGIQTMAMLQPVQKSNPERSGAFAFAASYQRTKAVPTLIN